jgi:hypothetical protein
MSRTRTLSSSSPGSHDYIAANNGVLTVTKSNTAGAFETKTITDTVTSQFAKRRAQGQVILNDVSLSRSKRGYVSGSVTIIENSQYQYTYAGDTPAGHLEPFICAAPVIIGVDSGLLLVEAYAKMNSAPLMTGEVLATLGQTVAMFRRPFKTATELLWKIHKRRDWYLNKMKSMTRLKANASSWLEARYGWQPIILDCKEIVKQVHKDRERCDTPRLVCRKGSKSAGDSSGSLTRSPTSSYTSTINSSVHKSVRCDVGVIFDSKSRTGTDKLLGILGLRGRDFPSTLYELTPFSFVADWFVNMGSWIQAVVPDPDISVRGNWVTTIYETVSTVSGSCHKHPDFPNSPSFEGSLGSSVLTTLAYNRTVNNVLPTHPGLTQRTVSGLHQLDAAALSLGIINTLLKGVRH